MKYMLVFVALVNGEPVWDHDTVTFGPYDTKEQCAADGAKRQAEKPVYEDRPGWLEHTVYTCALHFGRPR